MCSACECQGPRCMLRRGTRLSDCRINRRYNCLKFDVWVRSDHRHPVEIAVYKSYITTRYCTTVVDMHAHSQALHTHNTHTQTHRHTLHTHTHTTHTHTHTVFCQRIAWINIVAGHVLTVKTTSNSGNTGKETRGLCVLSV